MAEEPRKKSTGKPPITRHPLFPATVALWFGALFGLGSVAIRASLLESVVVSLGLDAIFPSMAPPLGATARILLALTLAIIGGVIGTFLARRIADSGQAPKAKREKGSFISRRSAQEPAQRRRPLTVKEEEPRRPEYRDHAPVPGTTPQILNVEEFDLDGFEDRENDTPDEPVAHAHADTLASQAGQPPEMREPEQEQATFAEPFDAPETVVAAVTAEVDAQPANLEPPAPFEAPPQQCDASLSAPTAQEDAGEAAWPGVRKPAGFAPPPAAVKQAAASAPAEPSALPRFDLAKSGAPNTSSVFNQAPAAPLFGNSAGDTEQPAAEAEPKDTLSEPIEENAAPFTNPTGSMPDLRAETPTPAAQPHQENYDVPAETDSAPVPKPEPGPEAETRISAAERIESDDLASLSHVELLERLALSLKRRRAQTAETVPAASAPAAEPETPTEPAAPAPITETAEEIEPTVDNRSDTPFEAPATDEPASTPPPAAIPAALMPVGFEDDGDENDLLPEFVPPRHIAATIEKATPPADGESDIAAQDQSEAGKPDVVLPRLGASETAPFSTAEEYTDDDAIDDAEEQELEEGYSSLLNLSRPGAGKQNFVRIEEPEADFGEIEPVVVFPGQEASQDAPFARPKLEDAPKPAQAPAPPEVQGPIDPSAPPPFAAPADMDMAAEPQHLDRPAENRDPEETERALRSALATLQRMSGAA